MDSASGKRKLLLVDDENDIRILLAQVLESKSFRVIEASSGREALNLYRKEPVDLVLSDIRMPDGDGIFLLNQLRQEFGTRTPILFMSGYADVSAERLFDLGAELLIGKPFTLSSIINEVNRAAQPPARRWSDGGFQHLHAALGPVLTLKIHGSADSGSETFRLGRGGFFAQVESASLRSAEELRFDLTFEEGPVKRLEGWGRRSWSRANYIGVEIQGLTPESLQGFDSWAKNHGPIAFIPAAPGAR